MSSIEEVERGEDKRCGISFLIDQEPSQQQLNQQRQAQQTAYDQSVIHQQTKMPRLMPQAMEVDYPHHHHPRQQQPQLISSLNYIQPNSNNHMMSPNTLHNHHPSMGYRTQPTGYPTSGSSSPSTSAGSPTSVIMPMPT